MYRAFDICNYRGLKELYINSLERINLITGRNNVGKTALLEAMFIHSGWTNPELIVTVMGLRGIERFKLPSTSTEPEPWDNIFPDFSTKLTIRLEATDNENNFKRILITHRSMSELDRKTRYLLAEYNKEIVQNSSSLSLEPTTRILEFRSEGRKKPQTRYLIVDKKGFHTIPPPELIPFPSRFLTSRIGKNYDQDADLFSQLVLDKAQSPFLEALKILEPNLTSISVISKDGQAMLYADIGLENLLPFAFIGEGTNRLASIALAIGNCRNGVLFIDEIECGIHYSVLRKVWTVIADMARQFNVQIFASTHSRECIMAAHEAFSESLFYDFRLYRLQRQNGSTQAISYDQEELAGAKATDLEVR